MGPTADAIRALEDRNAGAFHTDPDADEDLLGKEVI